MYQAFEMIDAGHGNPYHLLFYMISNFLIADIKKTVIYYYKKTDSPLVEGVLSILPKNFIRHTEKLPGINYISFNAAIVNFNDFAIPSSYILLRELFEDYISECKHTRIYIRRLRAPRVPVNDDEIIGMLKRYDYKIVILENEEPKEQIRIVSEAASIISPHGAGLAWTVFCSPLASVVEICENTNTELKHYAHIAHTLNHRFFRFQKISNGIVDVSELENTLISLYATH
jgi:hypothetical protein